MNSLSITPACLFAALLSAASASAQEAKRPPIAIHSVSVDLPASTASFPPGAGSDIAGKCLICHSAGMVLRQPPLSQDQWKTVINKMRSAYGAPILDSEVDPLSVYFTEVARQRAAQ
jgi:cytochrome c5